jgi:hypothetical protein
MYRLLFDGFDDCGDGLGDGISGHGSDHSRFSTLLLKRDLLDQSDQDTLALLGRLASYDLGQISVQEFKNLVLRQPGELREATQ